MTPRRICVVTGSRADYGLLYWPMRRLADDPDFTLRVAATGMHLAPAFGETWRDIEQDGFTLSARVEMLLAGDSPSSIAKSLGLGVIGFADLLERDRPDLMLVLGDRFEILAAVQAALIARVPVAHLCGGDLTEGAFDESIRHAITKLSQLHFPTNTAAAERILAMGEDPARVHVVGSPGVDRIRHLAFRERQAFFDAVGLSPQQTNLLVVFHPVTLGGESSLAEVDELLAALERMGPEVGVLLTGSNADTEGQSLNHRLSRFAARRANTEFRMSLGSELFLNALKHCDALIGNSSSGLYEAPVFGTPAVNVGDRQQGRLRARSVLDCAGTRDAILAAIQRAIATGRMAPESPYGDGTAAEQIVAILRAIPDYAALVRKPFHSRGVGP